MEASRVEFLAAQDQRGSRACHLGGIDHEHDGRGKNFSEIRRSSAFLGVESIEDATVAFNQIDSVGDTVATKRGTRTASAPIRNVSRLRAGCPDAQASHAGSM